MSKSRDLANLLADGAITADELDVGQIGGRRNLIINGAMQVAQRGTSESGITSSGYYTVDRFRIATSGLGTWTMSQSTDAPNGFGSSLKLDCTTAEASPSSASYLVVEHKIEGQDLQGVAKGTADAKPITVSFWVKCTKTGTFQASLRDLDNSRQVASNVTINLTDTWEFKSFTLPADTVGQFDNDNNASLTVDFWLDAGSTFNSGSTPTSWQSTDNSDRAAGTDLALGDSTDNEFQITGVQLEVGTVATPFEHRSYGEELALCQRYFEVIKSDDTSGNGDVIAIGHARAADDRAVGIYKFTVTKRAVPDVTYLGSSGSLKIRNAAFSSGDATAYASYSNTNYVQLEWTRDSGGLVDGAAAQMRLDTDSFGGKIYLDAEL